MPGRCGGDTVCVTASTTDWLQAWGTVAGAVFAAAAAVAAFLVLLHEIRVRRRDEADLRAATARMVIVTTGDVKGAEPQENAPGSLTSVEVYVNNFSRFPVVDVSLAVGRVNGKREYMWASDLIRPGESQLIKCVFHPPVAWPYSVHPPSLLRTVIIFTDDNGFRWQRVDRNQPSRIVIDGDLPEWYLWPRRSD